jgi:tetratricopeptide (TPR) repeat protein
MGLALMVSSAVPEIALAQLAQDAAKKKEQAPGATEEGAKPEYSKEFRKLASKAQEYVNEKKWTELLETLPEIEALPALSNDEKKVLATWRLQAAQGMGDQEALAAAIEVFLKEGYAEPDQVGVMHRQLAAHYSNKQDKEKTLHHFRQFVDATPDVEPDELETLGRLYLQGNHYAEAQEWLGKAIDLSVSKGQKPKEAWFQLRDRAFVETKDNAGRLANLESLVSYYPNKDYYSRIVAMYQSESKDDRIVMLNAYRLAVTDPLGGLATVGGYLNYADTALVGGSPGEAQRALERGMKEGIVPNAGTNQQALQEAKTAVAADKKSLPAEAVAAEKNPKGEVGVKVGLGFYSTGDYEQAVAVTRKGIAKGGVQRLDDANLLLGAALVELGRTDEARAAFDAAVAAAPAGSLTARIAKLWLARVERPAAAPAPATGG